MTHGRRSSAERHPTSARAAELAIDPRENPDGVRNYPYFGDVRGDNFRRRVPLRVLTLRPGVMRYFNRAVGRQEVMGVALGERSDRVKKWAYENAYTLIVMASLFAITWTAMLLYGIWGATHGE